MASLLALSQYSHIMVAMPLKTARLGEITRVVKNIAVASWLLGPRIPRWYLARA